MMTRAINARLARRASLAAATALAIPLGLIGTAIADDVPDLDPNALAIVGGALDHHSGHGGALAADRGRQMHSIGGGAGDAQAELEALWQGVGEVGDAMAINDAMQLEGDRGDRGGLIEVIFVPADRGETIHTEQGVSNPNES